MYNTVSLEVAKKLKEAGIDTLTDEEWAYIADTNQYYAVSTEGRVISFARDGTNKTHIMKPTRTPQGYVRLSINVNGKRTNANVHRLVLSTFVGPQEGLIYVNHKDGIKHNNKLSNLEWCTASQNNLHAYAMGLSTRRGAKNSKAILTEREVLFIRYIKGLYPSVKPIDIARFYGISNTPINKILNFQSWV